MSLQFRPDAFRNARLLDMLVLSDTVRPWDSTAPHVGCWSTSRMAHMRGRLLSLAVLHVKVHDQTRVSGVDWRNTASRNGGSILEYPLFTDAHHESAILVFVGVLEPDVQANASLTPDPRALLAIVSQAKVLADKGI